MVSPTAIDLMSAGQLGFDLFKAARLAPHGNCDTFFGTFPEAKRLTMLLREALIEIGRGMLMISMRCWILRPDGPAAVPLGKECKMDANDVVTGGLQFQSSGL